MCLNPGEVRLDQAQTLVKSSLCLCGLVFVAMNKKAENSNPQATPKCLHASSICIAFMPRPREGWMSLSQESPM
jgi:hypothetical protein